MVEFARTAHLQCSQTEVVARNSKNQPRPLTWYSNKFFPHWSEQHDHPMQPDTTHYLYFKQLIEQNTNIDWDTDWQTQLIFCYFNRISTYYSKDNVLFGVAHTEDWKQLLFYTLNCSPPIPNRSDFQFQYYSFQLVMLLINVLLETIHKYLNKCAIFIDGGVVCGNNARILMVIAEDFHMPSCNLGPFHETIINVVNQCVL